MAIYIKPSKRGSLHTHLGVPQGSKIPASKLSIKSGDSPAIRKKKQFAINARKWHHANGGTIEGDGKIDIPTRKPVANDEIMLNQKYSNIHTLDGLSNKARFVGDNIPSDIYSNSNDIAGLDDYKYNDNSYDFNKMTKTGTVNNDSIIGRRRYMTDIINSVNYESGVKNNPVTKNDKITTIGEDKPELKYLRNAKITESAKKEIEKSAKRFNIDPNVLTAAMAIENKGMVNGNLPSVQNLSIKLAKSMGIPDISLHDEVDNKGKKITYSFTDDPSIYQSKKDSLQYNKLAKELRLFGEDGKINDEAVFNKFKRVVIPRIINHKNEINSIESNIAAQAAYISLYGLNSVNPKQQIIPGVKDTYENMVKKGADYIRSRKIFDETKTQMKVQKAQGGVINITPDMITSIKRHAYGSKITPTNSWDNIAQVGIGALQGGILGAINAAIGEIGKSKQKAQLLEANRQQTIANMNQRTETDSLENSYNINRTTSFYFKGGRLHANGGTVPGMNPLSHDSELAVGPKHEQGGISAGPNDEVEGGETMQQQGDQTIVFSDRLKVPGTNVTFAQASLPFMKLKGQLEKSFSTNEQLVAKQRKVIDTPTTTQLVVNSAKRRAQITSMKSDKILSQISMINQQLDGMFQTQEQLNGDTQQEQQGQPAEQGGEQLHGGGGSYFNKYFGNQFGDIANQNTNMLDEVTVTGKRPLAQPDYFNKYFGNQFNSVVGDTSPSAVTPESSATSAGSAGKIDPQIAFAAVSGGLDTMSKAISSYQMSKLPVPTMSVTKTPRFNTYVDNSKDISGIDTSVNQTIKFIKDNTSNPTVRRASIMSVMNQANKAKDTSFFNKASMERDLENKNVQLAFETDSKNKQIMYENAMMQYNSSMAGLNRQSQIGTDLYNKGLNISQMQASKQSNDIAFASILSQYPEGVRKQILQNIRSGMSKGEAISKAYPQ